MAGNELTEGTTEELMGEKTNVETGERRADLTGGERGRGAAREGN